ncbi:Iron-containing alcohol dehydrogenase family protein OS=Streptomyces tendae OX=1932 GN=GUR47_02595 PE=4 SV=1 [Streptomyces tendae]
MAGVLRRTGCRRCPRRSGSPPKSSSGPWSSPPTRPGRYTILEHLDLKTDQIKDLYADYVKAIGS